MYQARPRGVGQASEEKAEVRSYSCVRLPHRKVERRGGQTSFRRCTGKGQEATDTNCNKENLIRCPIRCEEKKFHNAGVKDWNRLPGEVVSP